MLLQTGIRFTVPFAFTAGFGLLLVLAGVALYGRFGEGGSVDPLAARAAAAALAGFGLGLVALALDFAGTMAGIQTGLDRPDGSPMEPTLLGEFGLAAPWEHVAFVLFLGGAAATLLAVVAAVRAELEGS